VLPELLLASIFLGDLCGINRVTNPHPNALDNVCRNVDAPFALRVITLRVLAVQGASRSLDDSPGAAELYAHLRSGPKMSGLASTTLKSTKYRLPSSESFLSPLYRPMMWMWGRGSRVSDSNFLVYEA
jgi:hypothetical protein